MRCDERLVAGAEGILAGPQDAFGIDPAEIGLEQFLGGWTTALFERLHPRAIGLHDGIIGARTGWQLRAAAAAGPQTWQAEKRLRGGLCRFYL
jgi:hypothetical protein